MSCSKNYKRECDLLAGAISIITTDFAKTELKPRKLNSLISIMIGADIGNAHAFKKNPTLINCEPRERAFLKEIRVEGRTGEKVNQTALTFHHS